MSRSVFVSTNDPWLFNETKLDKQGIEFLFRCACQSIPMHSYRFYQIQRLYHGYQSKKYISPEHYHQYRQHLQSLLISPDQDTNVYMAR